MRRNSKALAAGAAATAIAVGAAILIATGRKQRGGLDKVRRNKFDRWFDTLDVDGDEFISEHDLRQAADRVLTARGVPVDSPMGLELRDATLQLWTDFIASADTVDGRVGRRELRAALAANMLSDRVAAGAKLASVADAYFTITDADGDGLISSGEFVQLLRNWNRVDYQESHRLFEYLDADHDNRISPDEWRHAIYGFFLNSDRKCPTNDLMGKIGSPILAPTGSLRVPGTTCPGCHHRLRQVVPRSSPCPDTPRSPSREPGLPAPSPPPAASAVPWCWTDPRPGPRGFGARRSAPECRPLGVACRGLQRPEEVR